MSMMERFIRDRQALEYIIKKLEQVRDTSSTSADEATFLLIAIDQIRTGKVDSNALT